MVIDNRSPTMWLRFQRRIEAERELVRGVVYVESAELNEI